MEPEINFLLNDTSIDTFWTEITKKIKYDEYLSVDESLSTFGSMTDNEIVAEVWNKKIRKDESSDEEQEAGEIEKKEIPAVSQASNYVEKLKLFVEGQEIVADSVLFALQTLEEFTLNMEIKQKKIRRK